MTFEFSGANVKVKRLWWQERGMSYTPSGYGRKIPTEYMVWHQGLWRRVYLTQWSNGGSTWIDVKGEEFFVNLNTDHALKIEASKESESK